MTNTTHDPVDQRLEVGLKNLWFPLCPSNFVKENPIALRRLGVNMAVWRDDKGKVHALEDRCPHRGAPLSQGAILGNRLTCPYHGAEIRCDGVVTKVPGSPGCTLEGQRATKSYHTREVAGVVFVYNSDVWVENPPEFTLPEELANAQEYSNFLCYTEWKCDYRYALDNVMDPMHGTFLHKQSHAMFQGDTQAKFGIRTTDTGFIFEKEGQRDVNFDWTEFGDTGVHWLKLAIPYPKTGGPGGNFIIIGMLTPIEANLCGVYFWRVRKLAPGWQRDTWRFLYRNRLEARHWHVLEQDRVMLEVMPQDANQFENLYQHDLGLVRLRRHLRAAAQEQLDAESAAA